MIDFNAPLFWYKLIFMTELIVSEAIFTLRLRRRDFFGLRLILCLFILYGFAFAIPIVAYNALWVSFMFLSMFAMTLCAMKICFAESWWNILFCGIASYTAQHLAFVLYSSIQGIVMSVFEDFLITKLLDPYTAQEFEMTDINMIISLLMWFIAYYFVNLICYLVYAKRIQPYEDLRLGRTRFVLLAGIIILTAIVFSLITQYNEKIDIVSLYLEYGYNFITCILALQLQFSQLNEKEIKSELSTVQQILHEEQKQYETVKENIDIINVKCHDLKHQIRALRNRDAAIDKEELKEIEQAVSIYQSVVKTGNEALDLILTEKSLLCEKNRICLSCIADGEKLNFIRPSDIYALLGNALDNAIEAVIRLPESKRNIGFSVKSIGAIISVHIENYFTGNLKIKNGLPQTTKGDINYHGYGMLSMKAIAEKYGGTLAVETVKNTFNLNVLFPKRMQTDYAIKTTDCDHPAPEN